MTIELAQLDFKSQLELFRDRGMEGINVNEERQLKTISSIGYYSLKSYAYPFYDSETKTYNGITFSQIVARYYRDKRFKQNILQAIEDIEVTLNTKISYYMGENYGPFGYQNFYKWCQNSGKNRYLKNVQIDKFFLENEKLKFLSSLQSAVKKSSNKDIKAFNSQSNDVFPPIWLLVNTFTLGQSIHILKLMNNDNRKKIAEDFNCTFKELISWLDCINLIRNICCHNGNLIDLTIRTKPKVPSGAESFIQINDNEATNKIALPIVIIVYLIKEINTKYKFTDLTSSLLSLFNGVNDDAYGFKNKDVIFELFGEEKKTSSQIKLETIKECLSVCNFEDLEEVEKLIEKRHRRLLARKNRK
ncbi:Abi family protein [Periweissella fabaria]|uniref:Abortive infection bacteriophage resistance protein n=2 Tax=Periweissella fabaria TaxID=546157 RepID=A0ABM8Z8W0_9LACO|nr:Abi family protein [Periweissella fabaria]MCM0597719.1 Abi family protein [Periweissella fabaria]CAH0417168.1 hypothetical protein WFA24289_01497 [Periweissella fabaria]